MPLPATTPRSAACRARVVYWDSCAIDGGGARWKALCEVHADAFELGEPGLALHALGNGGDHAHHGATDY